MSEQLPECPACTDPRSEGTHSLGTLQHPYIEPAAQPTQGRHTYKPLPRGDHEIMVRLCYDCDCWHANDDSVLYNEGQLNDWKRRVQALEAEVETLRVKAGLYEKVLTRLAAEDDRWYWIPRVAQDVLAGREPSFETISYDAAQKAEKQTMTHWGVRETVSTDAAEPSAQPAHDDTWAELRAQKELLSRERREHEAEIEELKRKNELLIQTIEALRVKAELADEALDGKSAGIYTDDQGQYCAWCNWWNASYTPEPIHDADCLKTRYDSAQKENS